MQLLRTIASNLHLKLKHGRKTSILGHKPLRSRNSTLNDKQTDLDSGQNNIKQAYTVGYVIPCTKYTKTIIL